MQRNFLHSLKAYLWELRGWLVVVHVHTTKRAQKIHGTRNGTHSKVAAIKKSISCIASTTKYSILSPLCRDIHYGFYATATTHGQHFEDLQQHGLFNLPKNAKQRGTEEESITRILLTTKSQSRPPLHRIGSSFPKSSRHMIFAGKIRWMVRNACKEGVTTGCNIPTLIN